VTAPRTALACDHGASYGDNERRTCVVCGETFAARPEDQFTWPSDTCPQGDADVCGDRTACADCPNGGDAA
jgi:hypothetical protein